MLNVMYIFISMKLKDKEKSSKMFDGEKRDGSEQTVVD